MSKAIFITATDTEIGKTLIGAGLGRAFYNAGYKVGCCKTMATGESISSDAMLLKEGTKSTASIEEINPLLFSKPLAPSSAAEIDGEKINVPELIKKIKTIISKNEISIIEGVGGLMVPLTKHYMIKDLIKDLGLPVIFVSWAKLGTINHTLMTSELLEQTLPGKILGCIYNGKTQELVSQESLKNLENLMRHPMLAKIDKNNSYIKNLDKLAKKISTQIDIHELYKKI